MIYGLYLSANGLVTQGMRADVIANNLANASTHGFKRDFLALRQRQPEVLRNGGTPMPQTQRHMLAIGGAVEGDRSHSIFSQGPLQKTGNQLDLALNGPGFFKYSDAAGNTYYSRSGSLIKDKEDFLVGFNGFRLLTDDGGPIQLEPGDEYYIDKAGRIIINGDPGAQIAMVNPTKLENLHKLGENLFEVLGDTQEVPVDPNETQLETGHLEASTVSPIREMTALIQANRAYQANAKVLGIQDDTLGKAVNRIAT